MSDKITGRFTLVGGAEVEKAAQALIQKATRAILALVSRDHVRTLVLVGGYGRGEGGIRRDGVLERLAGPFEFILFAVGLRSEARRQLAAKIEAEIGSLRRRYATEVHVSVVDAHRVERDRVRLRWYEARHGHRHLAGDRGFLAGLDRFEAQAIDPMEFTRLVVDRGALLIVNDLMRSEGPLAPPRIEASLTHTAEAIVGYGDALLFGRGRYHWSEVERRRLMAEPASPADPGFKVLYEAAMLYRFEGDPAAAVRLQRAVESGHLKETLGRLHLDNERRRLGARFRTFEGYAGRCLSHEIAEMGSPFRKLAHGALTLVRGALTLGHGSTHSPGVTLVRAGGEAGALRALFPLILYGIGNEEDSKAAREILGVKKARSNFAQMAWLRLWSKVAGPRVGMRLKSLGLSIDVAA